MAAGIFAFASAFLACAVELVEAATIVLAVGFTRGWRPALGAAALSTAIAAAAIAVFGPALERVPLDDLRLVVGILLLFFGVQWLKKAILRASGHGKVLILIPMLTTWHELEQALAAVRQAKEQLRDERVKFDQFLRACGRGRTGRACG